MRNVLRLTCLLLALALLASCAKKAKSGAVDFGNPNSKFSYAIGLDIGTSLKDVKDMVDLQTILKGMEDQLAGKTPLLKPEEATQIKQEMFTKMQAALSQKNIKEEEKFFSENKSKPGVIATPSGLQYQVIKEGSGPKPTAADVVTVHYTGMLIDGKEFDSSMKRGQPATFPLNGVIPGWTEGIQLMKVGGKSKLFIPSKLGYGERGTPGGPIPPNATLIFEVELLSIGQGGQPGQPSMQ